MKSAKEREGKPGQDGLFIHSNHTISALGCSNTSVLEDTMRRREGEDEYGSSF